MLSGGLVRKGYISTASPCRSKMLFLQLPNRNRPVCMGSIGIKTVQGRISINTGRSRAGGYDAKLSSVDCLEKQRMCRFNWQKGYVVKSWVWRHNGRMTFHLGSDFLRFRYLKSYCGEDPAKMLKEAPIYLRRFCKDGARVLQQSRTSIYAELQGLSWSFWRYASANFSV